MFYRDFIDMIANLLVLGMRRRSPGLKDIWTALLKDLKGGEAGGNLIGRNDVGLGCLGHASLPFTRLL